MTMCGPLLVWSLSRRGRQQVSWDVDGLPEGATAALRLEAEETWHDLAVSIDRTMLSIWAAGPDLEDPGDVLVVPATSHVEIRVVAGQSVIFLDGGYIELLP